MLAKKKGFTLIEILLVVAVSGILTTAAVPKFFNVRRKAQENVCLANRHLIDRVDTLYFVQEGKHSASVQELVDAKYLGDLPECPCGGVYLWVPASEDNAQYNVVICSMHGTNISGEKKVAAE